MTRDTTPSTTPTEIIDPPAGGEPYLLTPGPLTTSNIAKQAMLKDWGSWDEEFRSMTRQLRTELLSMVGDNSEEYECVPMQGSGTFVVEAMLGSLVPRDGKVLVLINGAYGQRIAKTLQYLDRAHSVIDKGDFLPPRGAEVGEALKADPGITHVVVVHCETSSGILNPIEEISEAVYAAGRKLLIDSMSGFGALTIAVDKPRFEAIVSSANKCIEGVPGFGFVLVRRRELEQAKGCSHSLSLDLYDQWFQMEKTGQWRFTPPTHVVAAFIEALRLHREAGGAEARLQRYTRNRDVLVEGMRKIGFETLLQDHWLSPIIVTFFNPADQRFEFKRFYDLMKEKGFIIYPGKLTAVDSFRIGCIGQMDQSVMRNVVEAVSACLSEMGVVDANAPSAAFEERAKIAG
ncbi:MAG: 2-aminoethylphosphonate--pyruvate transaminase [Granulosicoccaceae bacterium]